MLKKRLLILAVLLCALLGVASEPSSATGSCTCAMTCGAGGKGAATCEYECSGNSLDDIAAAKAQCCSDAEANTPMDCPVKSPGVSGGLAQ